MRPLCAAMLVPLMLGVVDFAPAQGLSGQRVRVTSARLGIDKRVGRVLSASSDTVTIDLVSDTMTVAFADLDRLELRQRGGRRTGRGALIGFAAGAITGFVIGAGTYEKCVPQAFFDCYYAPESASQQGVVVGAGLAAVGTVIGAIVGSNTRAEEWRAVRRRGVRASVRPLPDGHIGAGLSLSF